MKPLHSLFVTLFAAALAAPLQAKLPAPSPEAKAKADEAKAKTAHSDKVGAYKLCLSMERTAAHYLKTVGTAAKAPTPTPPCADPGPFVYDPNAAAAPVTAAPVAPVVPAKAGNPPLEAAGAHSPAKTAVAPPSGKATAAEQAGTAKK